MTLPTCPECDRPARIFVVRGRMICQSCRDRLESSLSDSPPGPGEVSGRAWCQARGLDGPDSFEAHETPVQNISVRAEAEGVRGSAVEVPARIDDHTRRLLWWLAAVIVISQLAWLNPLP